MMISPLYRKSDRIESPRERIIFIIGFSLFIFIFLFLYAPFGMAEIETKTRFFISAGFGLVTAFVLVVFIFLLEPVVIRGNWKIWKHIVWDITVASSVGVANYFYVGIIFRQNFAFKSLLYSIWAAILVGAIPVTISHILFMNRKYRKALKIKSFSDDDFLWEDEVTIRGGNSKNEFRCNPKNIVYICSNDNYITIVTSANSSLVKTHLRGTLKETESELGRNTSFFRCHKCYIINSEYVDHVSGNLQNMKIKLREKGVEIPVSRSKAPDVVKRFRKSQ